MEPQRAATAAGRGRGGGGEKRHDLYLVGVSPTIARSDFSPFGGRQFAIICQDARKCRICAIVEISCHRKRLALFPDAPEKAPPFPSISFIDSDDHDAGR